MKILLTNPRGTNVFGKFGFIFPPTGLLYVAAYSEMMGCDVTIKDFFISDENPKNFSFKDYDIVGITSDTKQFPHAMDISRAAKKAGCTVVIGGVHPSSVHMEVQEIDSVDFVVHGEGELTFYELVRTLESKGNLSNVKGISYMVNGTVSKTHRRELILNPDKLPFPARHLIDIEAYNKRGFKYGGERLVAMISSSRGCPYDCFFCAVPFVSGRKWRSRSVDSIMAEIDELYNRYGYRAIVFSDDNFTISTKRVKELCKRILEKRYDLWWWCMSSPNTLIKNEDMVELMARAGAKTVFIGVESGSEKTLEEFNKKMDTSTAEKAVAVLKKYGIEIYASYIIGGINDNASSILRTIKFARKLDTNVAQFSILTPYPGTVLYEKLKGKISNKNWLFYDGVHLVFKHEKVPYNLMQFLLIWAYISFYMRNWCAIKGFFKTFSKNNPVMKKMFNVFAIGH